MGRGRVLEVAGTPTLTSLVATASVPPFAFTYAQLRKSAELGDVETISRTLEQTPSMLDAGLDTVRPAIVRVKEGGIGVTEGIR